jgi:hypothetical protein
MSDKSKIMHFRPRRRRPPPLPSDGARLAALGEFDGKTSIGIEDLHALAIFDLIFDTSPRPWVSDDIEDQ